MVYAYETIVNAHATKKRQSNIIMLFETHIMLEHYDTEKNYNKYQLTLYWEIAYTWNETIFFYFINSHKIRSTRTL